MLEVATHHRVDDEVARSAAREYEGSKAFREFVTSAYISTQLPISMDDVIFEVR